jgi:diguanylate cyclase
MNYTEERQQAGEYLRLALAYMAKHNLPADPVSYTVWYEYASGRNAKLKKVIDQSVEKKIDLDREKVEKLYQKYVTDGDRIVIGKLLTKISLMLKEITRHVSESVEDLAGSGEHLEQLSDQIAKVQNYDDIRNIVDQMIDETRKLVKSGKRLQNRMKISSEDLKQLNQELEKSQKEAQTDTLTGLINRRGLNKQFEIERIRTKQNDTVFSIILLDIDHFKLVNDQYGHLVGDSLLRGIAKLLNAHLRQKDIAARFGGEEFLILLPETDIKGAVAVGQKIQKTLAAKEWKIKESGQTMGKISVSMGIALYQANESEKDLISRADNALYMAKNNGRDLIVTQDEL